MADSCFPIQSEPSEGWNLTANKAAVPAGRCSSGCEPTYWNWFHREQERQEEEVQWGKAVMGFPTSFPASFLSDDGGSQRDRHLHLGLGAGREDDGRFLDGALDLVFFWRHNLEDQIGS